MIDRIDVFPAPLFPISKTFCSGIGARRALRAKTSLSPPPGAVGRRLPRWVCALAEVELIELKASG